MENQVVIYETNNAGEYTQLDRSTDDDQLLQLWATKHRKSDSGNTAANYARTAAAFLLDVGKPLQAIHYADLEAWAHDLSGSINTRRAKIYTVKSLFSFAQRIGYIRINPGEMLSVPAKEETKHRKMLSEEEVIRLVASDLSLRDEAILRVLYSSGCRVTELINLKWQDIIEQPNGSAILVIRGKGSKTRESGISAAAYRSVTNIKPIIGLDVTDTVFKSSRKKPMERTTINWLFSKLSEKIGKPISPHWFRHSHASHALARGANPVDVQEQLGHSSLQITTGYAHKQRSSSDYLPI